MNLEKELKILLSEEEFNLLSTRFEWNESRNQLNLYYSDKDFELMKQKISVRVRSVLSDILLQVKMPVSENQAIHIRNEHEKKISIIPDCFSASDLCQLCSVDYLPDVNLIGFLMTQRKQYDWSSDVQICLDRNVYLDCIDYELEIEFANELPSELKNILSELSIVQSMEIKGKYTRFMEMYLGLLS